MTSTGILIVRERAQPLAQRLASALDAEIIGAHRPPELSAAMLFQAHFHRHRRWVLIMASGIASRFLAGLPDDKRHDPAVVVVDEAGRWAVPILSGHEGGGNALAYAIGRCCGAVPVITTASEALRPWVLGIGCRKGVSEAAIEAAVQFALAGRSLAQVREVATIDLKAQEAGLLAFCARHDLPLRVMAQRDVAARAWVTQPSAWVQQNIGVSGVCEPCALMASPRGRLIIPKTAYHGVTVALVEDGTDIDPA